MSAHERSSINNSKMIRKNFPLIIRFDIQLIPKLNNYNMI